MSVRADDQAEALVEAATPPVANSDQEDVVALLAGLLAGVERIADLAAEAGEGDE